MTKIERIKAPKVKKEAFTDMEIEKIRLQAIETGPRETMIVETLLSTGARVAELAQVKLCNIEGKRMLVHGKGQKDRYVYLNAKAELAMGRYLKTRNDDNPYLIPGCVMEKGEQKIGRPAERNRYGHIGKAALKRLYEILQREQVLQKGTHTSTAAPVRQWHSAEECRLNRYQRCWGMRALKPHRSILTLVRKT